MTDYSDIISAILAEWGDYSPLVEPEIFGTGDPGQIARNITAFCSTELGSAIDKCLFYHVSQGVVLGLRLEDGRQIVIKVHPPKQSREFLAAVYRVQHHLAYHGFPCPEPISGPISLIDGHATVEALRDAGIYADAHDPAIRRTMAETLYWLVDLTRDFAGMPGLPLGILSQRPGGALWPEPHSKIFDFEAARGIAFTPAERTTIAASGAYALAYSARCENCLDPDTKDFPAGSFREALARYGAKLISAD